MTLCDRCGWVHASDDARAISRFSNRRGFRANYPDSPLRATQAEAERDMCNRRAAGHKAPTTESETQE